MRPFTTHPATQHADLVVGFGTADDAGVFRLADGTLLVQTVDFFTPVVDDPYDWGRITASNALSDVYAMGGTPLTALQLVGWPRGVIGFDVLGRVLEGGADVMAAAGCTVVGGHSIDDGEPKYGFAVTGVVDEAALTTNSGGRDADRLVLTKPIGSGIITTAIKAGSAESAVARAAVEVMASLNDTASRVARGRVHACTDVTGYGLLGHLHEVAVASGLSAFVTASDVPLIPGVLELAESGVYPGGSGRNLESLASHLDIVGVEDSMVRVLADAQTSGGLLLTVGASEAPGLLADLEAAGIAARDIGGLIEGEPGRIEVRR